MRVPATLVLCLLAVAPLAAGCGSSSSTAAGGTTTAASANPYRARALVSPARAAPPIALRDQFGRRVTLRAARGQAVFLTFVYTHCPDVCPLILQALGGARRSLGADASRVKIIAVSVDPNGDRPAYVRKYLAARRLLRDVSYLVGTRRQLTPVWRAYHMLAVPEAKSELVSHSAVVYGIDAGGVMRTMYPGNPIDRRALAHDALVLAKR